MVKNNTSKNQRDSQIEVVTNWQHTEEVPLAFKRLMMLLLKPPDNQSVKTIRPDEEHENDQC